MGKNKRNTQAFLKSQMTKVKPVILPQGGLSYNPSAKEHKKVLDKVISEEIVEIESREKTNQALNPDLYKSHQEI